MKIITKSKYLSGLESDAYLWTLINEPEKIPPKEYVTQERLEEGKTIGEQAKKLFPKGIDLSEYEFSDNIEKTKEVLKQKKTIFEAGIKNDRCFARIDVITPNKEGWDLIEVKSSTRVKDKHIEDLSFQKYVAEKNGLEIKKFYVIHINNEYTKKGDLKTEELFKKTDVTEEVNKKIDVEEKIKHMLQIIDLPKCPAFNVDEITKSEYGNLFIDQFMKELPEGNVFQMYRLGKKKAIELYKNGITLMKEIPGDYKLNNYQEIQIKSQEKIYSDKEKIKRYINELEKPITHMDFESFSLAIPEYENTKPYQHIPFQYSLHIETEEGITHKEFLHMEKNDPRKNFIENLINDLPDKGSILVFHKPYEVPRLKEIAEDYPEYREEINKIIPRIKDLKDPFCKFWYHNKKQKGSNSIKKVLPIFSEKTHKGLVVSNGEEAMILYKKNRGALSEELKKDLLDYCELDTEAMVIILKGLREAIKE